MSPGSHQADRFYEIDLLRFIAALSVVFFHYTFRGYAANDMSPLGFPEISVLSRYGFLGVDLFFIISGFVILMTAQGREAQDFLTSRVSRLYPAFWACVTLTALVTALFGAPRFSVTLSQYVLNLSMFSGYFDVPDVDGVYWSLLVEIKFYFLVLLLILTGQIPRISIYLGGWLLFVAACHITSVPEILKVFLFPKWAPYFIAGATFFLIRRDGFNLYKVGLVAGAYGLAVYQAIGLDGWMRFYKSEISELAVGAIVTGFFAIFLLIATKRTEFLQRKGFLALGALTYPLYLLHQNIGYIFFQAFDSEAFKYLTLVAMLTLSLGASYVIHRYVEKPLGRWLKSAMREFFAFVSRRRSAGQSPH